MANNNNNNDKNTNYNPYTQPPQKYGDLTMMWVLIPFCILLLFMGIGGIIMDIVIIAAYLKIKENQQIEKYNKMCELDKFRLTREDVLKKQIQGMCDRIDREAAERKANEENK